ncbi:Bug family tripartite tricarboxylate transporter substrate binding protein [Candidimonas nitroreducens]|uniref:MFS transporter n=1 Tax=Candidimonas nitroreducens TaxID=683354 RepID=A0A225MGK6_9BURK|nr:tripartite tricarboxylate transporter substrate binding protein [Candidimonas nitroreducens]OWT60405.1 MFS transporter [Candidimonas nitroreducens]
MQRRTMLGGLASAALATALGSATKPAKAQASHYPSRAIRWIVPWPPGGGADLMARIINSKAGELLGQPLVIDNRGGAAGNIGTHIGAMAPADGYTITFGYSGTLAINPFVYPDPGWKQSDFDPVIFLSQVPLMLLVNAKLPVKNVREFIALSKTRQLTFGSSGPGSINHLAGVLFASMTGANLLHVPYRGGGPAMTAVLGGQVDALFMVPVVAEPQLKGGRIRILGVSSAKRSSTSPNIPTIAESGVPGYQVSSWNGVLTPKGTPGDAIATLNKAFNEAMADPAVRKKLVEMGYEIEGGKPERFTQWIDSELAKWGPVVKQANVHPA